MMLNALGKSRISAFSHTIFENISRKNTEFKKY